MRRVLIVVTVAVLALLAGSVATAEAGRAEQAGEVSTQAISGPYTLVNQRSQLCLDQDYSGGAPHTAILAWPCNRGSNQDWYWDNLGDGTVRMINARSGQCLDQDYSGGSPHYAVLAWNCNGGANQLWRPYYQPNENTYLYVNVASGWVLDQDYTGGVQHSAVLAVPYNGGLNQFWF
jgi:hypothetical protein